MKLFLLFLINFYLLYANNPITITKSLSNFKKFDMQMYRDDSAKLSFEDIRAMKDFELVSNSISDGYSKSNLWFKFQLKNSTNSSLKYIIYFTENMVHYLDCYIEDSDNNIKIYKGGVGYFVDGYPNKLDNPKFEIEFAKDELKTIYIRMYSIYPNTGAFYLFDEKGFNSYTSLYNNIYSAYFGGILALMLYNIFLFLFSRNISYLYYVMLLATYLLWQLTLNNFPPFQIFYSINSYYLAGIFVNFMMIFIIFFTRDILSTKRDFPILDKITVVFISIVMILTFITIFMGYSTTIYLNAVATVIFPFLLYIGVKSHFSGNKIAIFFIIAQVSFLVSSTMFSLMIQGNIPYNLFIRHSVAVGSAIELVLFSLILGYRIRLLQDEKIDIIDKANRELEMRVKERTKALQESKDILKEMTIRDSMTNLYNRRHLIKEGKKLIEDNSSGSLIILDIDKFKNVNDSYGHNIGDEVIVLFAKIILINIRDNDLAFRVGGEEFIVLLPHTNKDTAYDIANQIREVTEKEKIKLNDKDILSFTTSGGVSTLLKSDKDIEHTIKRADNALYEAKNSGRNRIVA